MVVDTVTGHPKAARTGYAVPKHIVIVDAEPAIRELLTIALELPGYTVAHASSEYETLVHLTSEPPPDAIIMGDLEPVPQTSLALIADIRQEGSFRRLPILMVSTQATPRDIEQGKTAGANRYLTKPFLISTLLTQVEEVFDEMKAA